MTRAERNNNPLNIRKSKDKFVGEEEVQKDPDFKQFKDNIHGYRAAFTILKTYRNKYGLKTIEEIINRWAPPSENDTEKYIKFVCYRSGIWPGEEIRINEYPLVVEAMAKMEGVQTPNRAEITIAFSYITWN